ncbi:MAG: ATP-binding cassette domain-containing protein, partial [Pseudomonadota bacterium]|nr:ATP-binding cassette domain-containing protein [Pseudomonadota bacterium]
RAYAPSKGLISVDGINILQYEPSALRRHIGYVPQDLSLFAGSLKDNITRFDDSIDEDEIWQVLEQCELAALVNNHPDGLSLNVGEKGALLSGGKRQAVAIARALIHSPDIFILDEPTASMDSNTEARLKAVLKARTQDKTLILNTHRTTLLDLVDRIIVVDHGKVLIDGPKQHVLNQLQAVLSQQPGVRPA